MSNDRANLKVTLLFIGLFLSGYFLGVIVSRVFNKGFEDTSKKLKDIEKDRGHPAFTVYRVPKQGAIPIRFHKPGKPPKNSKRLYPSAHPGGRPKDEIDNEAIELIYKGESIQEAWMVLKPKYIEFEIRSANNKDKARETFKQKDEIQRIYLNFRTRINSKLKQNYQK